MDEVIKIYDPKIRQIFGETNAEKKKPAKKLSSGGSHSENSAISGKSDSHSENSKWKFWFDGKTMMDIIEEHEAGLKQLDHKHPWVYILRNWAATALVVALFISFGIWGLNIHTERKAVAYAEAAVAVNEAEHRAYLNQVEADRKAQAESLENVMQHNAQVKAKLGYGSRNWIEKYHYGDNDFMTLYQCVDNRLKNSMYEGMTIDEIVMQEGQFISCYESNPVQDYYYNLAMKSERAKQSAVSQPVGSDYVYAVYTPHGIYLTNDPKSPEYTWWHYSE